MKKYFWPIGLGMLLAGHVAHADVLINVKATIVKPSCNVQSLSSGATDKLSMDFGNLSVKDVNTIAAKKTLNLKIWCGGASANSKIIEVTIQPGSFGISSQGQDVLQTDMTDLGIKLSIEDSGNAVIMNVPMPIFTTPVGIMKLTGELVSDKIDGLDGGVFNASATMIVMEN